MDLSGCSRESSGKRQENGDIASPSDRPHKKARFAWQVKGKHNLKNLENAESSSELDASVSNDNIRSQMSDNASDHRLDFHNLASSADQNLELLNDYFLNQDLNNSVSPKLCDEAVVESQKHPIKVPTRIASSTSCSSSHSRAHLLNLDPYCITAEEASIARWQSKQMIKGFIDNTINSIIETRMRHPAPTRYDYLSATDIVDFMNQRSRSIENEGILMAISAHGLQNSSKSDVIDDDIDYETLCSLPSNTVIAPNVISNQINSYYRHVGYTSAFRRSDNMNDNLSHNVPIAPIETPRSSTDSFSDYVGDDISHLNFMDAAVSFAIQSKGLTSQSSE